MNILELQAIANDICFAANSKFAQTKIEFGYKWILVEEKSDGTKMERKPIELLDCAVISTIHSLRDNQAYIKLMGYLESIDCVKNMLSNDGDCSWTKPDKLVTKLLVAAFLSSTRIFDSKQLLNEIGQLISIIDSKLHEITLVGRIHGVRLESDSIEIEPNISLVKLDLEAINQRQPFIAMTLNSRQDYSDSNAEIHIKAACPIATKDKSYWQAYEETKAKINVELDIMVKAIKLHCHGRFQIYPVSYQSSLTGNGGSFSILEPMFISNKNTLSNTDVDGLKNAICVIKNLPQDNVLERSFSRFLIGLDEKIPEEQLVDFVIAWESLLQTVNGSSNKTELVYRFSLNGAVILCEIDNFRKFTQTQTFMKKTYEIRSTIIHGGSTSSIDNDVKKLGFDNLSALNAELAKLYRKVIFWLSTLDKKERPYHKKFGWELLLRK